MLLFISLAVLFCSLPFAVSLMPQDSRQGAPDTSESSPHSTGEKYISVKKDGILCRMTLEDWTLYALCHELPDVAKKTNQYLTKPFYLVKVIFVNVSLLQVIKG